MNGVFCLMDGKFTFFIYPKNEELYRHTTKFQQSMSKVA